MRSLTVSLLELLLAGASVAQAQKAALDLRGFRAVDLTYGFDEETIYWPTSPTTFKLDKLAFGKTEGGYFYSSYSFCAPEHGGTHLDAPIHFAEGKRTAGQIPVEQLMAPAVVIDVSAAGGSGGPVRIVALVPKTNG
ncbi:MAG: cyclase family protein [Thermoanaerobaculia bacterium]